jgi:Tfp pilus assembly protein PilZ
MQPTETKGSHWDRRASGLLRVPFVRACVLAIEGSAPGPAFIVNINVLGAYLASDEIPDLGRALTFRFQVPESEYEAEIRGEVTWVNPRQQHAVHSLPPGFGVKFTSLPDDMRLKIESFVRDYTERQQR